MKVKVYSTPSCHRCIKIKEFLKERNIEFEEVNAAGNQELIEYIIEKTGQRGVPVVEIDGDMVVGLDFEKMKILLNVD